VEATTEKKNVVATLISTNNKEKKFKTIFQATNKDFFF
jgi:hypothetical protein